MCGHSLVRIGEDCAERIAAIPPQMIRTVRPKYACHHCEVDQPYRAGTAGWLLYRYRTYVEGCECNERHQHASWSSASTLVCKGFAAWAAYHHSRLYHTNNRKSSLVRCGETQTERCSPPGGAGAGRPCPRIPGPGDLGPGFRIRKRSGPPKGRSRVAIGEGRSGELSACPP